MTSEWIPAKILNGIVYSLQAAMAIVILRAALAKFLGDPDMLLVFNGLDSGPWLRYAVGTVEIAAALLLLTPDWSAWAAAALVPLMLMASLTGMGWVGTSTLLWSTQITGGIPVAPNALLLACLLVAWYRRDQFGRLSFLRS